MGVLPAPILPAVLGRPSFRVPLQSARSATTSVLRSIDTLPHVHARTQSHTHTHTHTRARARTLHLSLCSANREAEGFLKVDREEMEWLGVKWWVR